MWNINLHLAVTDLMSRSISTTRQVNIYKCNPNIKDITIFSTVYKSILHRRLICRRDISTTTQIYSFYSARGTTKTRAVRYID